jgi:hypothetical protein
MMVLMALVTTFMTCPALALIDYFKRKHGVAEIISDDLRQAY